ncbi:MAG: SIMPL domain-containing protein, partial [Candidatus Nealsonbacteria bacterium]|nr:SIMPL domain-containing protein [Candidatus Nealsonbacteria bacterium]
MNAVIDSIKNQGVESKDLKTASFNISPRYEWREKEVCANYPCPSERVLVGYEVYQSLQVKIRALDKVGAIIQGASDMGANDVSGLQFTVENEDELKSQARKQAIDEAKAKAKELSSQLGVDLARIVNFSESGSFPIPYYSFEKSAMGGAAPEAPQIETGENKIEATVTITYEIR